MNDELWQYGELLIQAHVPQGKLLHIWPLQGGLSATMTALEFERPDGQIDRLVARRPGASTLVRNPNAAADEFTVLRLLHAAGLAVPAPYYLDQSGGPFASPYLVLEYIVGAPLFAARPGTTFIDQLATQLARIHQLSLHQHDVSFLAYQSSCDECDRSCFTPADSFEEERIRALLADAV